MMWDEQKAIEQERRWYQMQAEAISAAWDFVSEIADDSYAPDEWREQAARIAELLRFAYPELS